MTPALRPVWLIVHQDPRRSVRIKIVSSAITDAFGRHIRFLVSAIVI